MLEIGNKLRENGYLSNSYINFAVMSAINGVPLLVEGDPGVGKTSLAYATAKMLDLARSSSTRRISSALSTK